MKRMGQELERDALHGFGAFLVTLRATTRHRVKQKEVIEHLPGWTHSSYSRLESGELAPRFEHLPQLYRALQLAGISFTTQTRHQFVDLARKRIASRYSQRDPYTDAEWAQLRFALARLDGITDDTVLPLAETPKPLLTETTHLLGRDLWRKNLLRLIVDEHKKLVVIRGPAGIGKSSELNWLATYCFQQEGPFRGSSVVLCDVCSENMMRGPEDALDILISNILVSFAFPHMQVLQRSREERLLALFGQLERISHPLLILIDHGEYLAQGHGLLAPCWQQFFSAFLRRQHPATLLLATRQWTGWYGGEHLFVEELPLPPLSAEMSVRLLQQVGLEQVPVALLEQVHQAVGGIPLCLEWVAALVKQPFFVEDWEEVMPSAQPLDTYIQAVKRLLKEPHIFGGTIAGYLTPLLERTITPQRLSPEATHLLQCLSVAALPLARPALQVLCPTGAHPVKELRHASLLVAYPDRVQLLPMVASAIFRQLSAEQLHDQENLLLKAYEAWIKDGNFHKHEVGKLIIECATLLFKHERFLDAAQFLIRYSWLSINQGYISRFACFITDITSRKNEETTEQYSGRVLLYHILAPFLGKEITVYRRGKAYQQIYEAICAEQLVLQPATELNIIRQLIVLEVQNHSFQKAQKLLDDYHARFASSQEEDISLKTALLEEQAWIFAKQNEYVEEQGDMLQAKCLREQTILCYKQCITLLTPSLTSTSFDNAPLKKRLARCYNNLSFHIHMNGNYTEALALIEQSIRLKEQGYTSVGTIATTYAEKVEILIKLGHFQEALSFDKKVFDEVQQYTELGYNYSQKESCIYNVIRGQLYLRLGRIEEAEILFREALTHPHIQSERRIYRMFAEDALKEIEQWRQHTHSSHHQLDWRWIERYRELDAFDAYWWWAYAGPFSTEEQQRWEQLYTRNPDAATKEQLGKLLAESQERELAAARTEQREPRFLYPALDLDEVHERMAKLQHLEREIVQTEPNAIVRRLYHEKITETLHFLSLFDATAQGDHERFWKLSQKVFPAPTPQEMQDALSHVQQTLQQGLQCEGTKVLTQWIVQWMQTHFHLTLDFVQESGRESMLLQEYGGVPSASKRRVSAQVAQKFFEAIFREYGYDGWHVVIDAKTRRVYVESGMRVVFLADHDLSLEDVKYYLTHEIAGHVDRAMAGERSPLGLLAIGTKNYMPTEEGIALYHERQEALLSGRAYSQVGVWMSTWNIGLACGVITPPQTFTSVLTFLEHFFALRRLLRNIDTEVPTALENVHASAVANCLRIYRGVPHLDQAGGCFTKDVVYLRGLRLIEGAVAQDETVLDRLAVGKVAIEELPALEELGITQPRSSLRKMISRLDLDEYILSFETEKHR